MKTYKPGRPIENTGEAAGKPPSSSGEYRILDEERKSLYIGETKERLFLCQIS